MAIFVGKYDNPHNIRKGLYHVIADSLPELEAFAGEMSISPAWISPGKGLIPACLDITSEELPAAIAIGAKCLSH